MYGIPNMKLDKQVVERRVQLLREEGVRFETHTQVGQPEDLPEGHVVRIMQERGEEIRYLDPAKLQSEFDALILATGATRCPHDCVCPMARRSHAIDATMAWRSTK